MGLSSHLRWVCWCRLFTVVKKDQIHTLKMGVTVETLEAGDGKTFAQKGQTVVVHYTGTLTNGKKFDSSLDRNKPFETEIGVGRVIKGWDEGFTKISLGETAKLTITPDYGYGASGAGNVIPPNATLIFEVKLLAIK